MLLPGQAPVRVTDKHADLQMPMGLPMAADEVFKALVDILRDPGRCVGDRHQYLLDEMATRSPSFTGNGFAGPPDMLKLFREYQSYDADFMEGVRGFADYPHKVIPVGAK
jgi:hypothetical protein